MKSTLKENLLNQIKKENIKPTPKIYFVIKDILKFLLFIFISIIWGIFVSVIIGQIINIWDVLNNISLFNALMISIPIVWVIILLLSTFLFFIFFKKIARWYRYSLIYILFINIIIYSFLWLLFFKYDIYNNLETFLIKNTNLYENHLLTKQEDYIINTWMNPDNWLLTWKIISYNLSNHSIVIDDFEWKKWDILIEEDTEFRNDIVFIHGNFIKIIWNRISEHRFIADRILPFKAIK